MKTFITRSATLAACATLLLAGAAVQASADGTHGTDQPAAPDMVVINKASKTTTIHNNVVGNNNNAAGNDLAVGNNNVLGTGHTVSQAPTSATSGSPLQFGLTNATNLPFMSIMYRMATTARGLIRQWARSFSRASRLCST
ncbi:hypothetical protein KJK32_45210 [Streptomyces sp. JCM17656]|nr:hypothetical protein KJK32_45210 [Streptomyces sp. JCM17656]